MRPGSRRGARRGASGCLSGNSTFSATDANRFAIRIARAVTGRPKILVFNGRYHGTPFETFAMLRDDGSVEVLLGNVGLPVDPALTTKVVELNDLDALERRSRPATSPASSPSRR